MRKIHTQDIIAAVAGSDLSELCFATKDGRLAFVLAEPLADGTRFLALEDDEAETHCIHVPDEAALLLAWCELTRIYGEDQESWVSDANDNLTPFHLKLGDYHRTPVTIEGDTYADGWFELAPAEAVTTCFF